MQIKNTVSLNDIIRENGKSVVQQWLNSAFHCAKNPDIEHFLQCNAIRFEIARIARTYLILDENSEILACFTLSFKSVSLNTQNKSQLKKLTGGLTNNNRINVHLIGQIGKNSDIGHNPICLNDILNEILPLIETVQAISGGRVIILECENKENLIAHYEKHGFKLVETVNEQDLKTMYLIPEFK